MDYRIKEVSLRNRDQRRKRLIIEFSDPKLQLLALYLMTDAPLMDWYVLGEMAELMAGERNQVEISGNRCKILATKEVTRIEDLLASELEQEAEGEMVELESDHFYSILKKWYGHVREHS